MTTAPGLVRPEVWGVVNVTPDSFSDGGRYLEPEAAVAQARRLVEIVSARPQLQERLGEDVAEALERAIAPAGVLVVIDARHGCVGARGPRQADSTTVTVAASGMLADPARRTEVMALIGGGAG